MRRKVAYWVSMSLLAAMPPLMDREVAAFRTAAKNQPATVRGPLVTLLSVLSLLARQPAASSVRCGHENPLQQTRPDRDGALRMLPT